MRYLEGLLVVLTLVGVIMQASGSEFGADLISIGLLLLSAIYLLFSFALLNGIDGGRIFKRETYKEVGTARLVLAALLGTMMMPVLTTGVLFGLAAWEGAWEMLAVAMFTAPIALVVGAVHMMAKEDRCYDAFARVVFWALFAGILFLTTPKTGPEFYEDVPLTEEEAPE